MARAMTGAQLIAACKKWRINYKAYPGFDGRGRGDLTNVVGLVEHHTGGSGQSQAYLKFLFVDGRSDVPGPLCNVATAANGVLHLGATRRANHAGSGSASTLSKVRNESHNGYASEISPGPDGTNGNGWYYGNEIMYSGAHAPTTAAYRTAVLHAAAICDFHGWTALSVIGHREHSRRKIDPGHANMAKFRRDVRTCLQVGPGVQWDGYNPKAPVTPKPPTTAPKPPTPTPAPKPPITPEDDVALTADDKAWIEQRLNAASKNAAQAVFDKQVANLSTPESGDTAAFSSHIAHLVPNVVDAVLAALEAREAANPDPEEA